MEKLIELLNEYDKGLYIEEQWEYFKPTWNMIRWEDDTFQKLTPAELCSKKFWFIRWLVKKWYTTLEYWNWFKNSVSEKTLITICAISDDPTGVLISYLK